MKSINLTFQGFWIEKNFNSIPNYSGIYVFQECYYDSVQNSVNLKKILYIGQANDCNERTNKHELLEKMRKYISYGNTLCVSTTEISDPDKSRAEAALVYQHKPTFNTQNVNNFDYDTTTISNSGRYSLLKAVFTVYKTISKVFNW